MTSPLSRLKVSSASGWGDVRTAGNRVRRKAVVRRQVGERRGRPGGRQKAKRGDGRDAPPPPPPPPPPDSLSPQPPALNISGAMDNSVPFIGAGGSGGGSGGGPGGGSGCCTVITASPLPLSPFVVPPLAPRRLVSRRLVSLSYMLYCALETSIAAQGQISASRVWRWQIVWLAAVFE